MLESIWSKYQLESFPRLTENIETDVLVIGGGISGILCAYFLAQSGKDVVVLEAEKVADKKTIRTTAVITALQDVMYSKLPLPKAKSFLKANLFALEEYKKLSLKYDFDFEECSSFKYSTILW